MYANCMYVRMYVMYSSSTRDRLDFWASVHVETAPCTLQPFYSPSAGVHSRPSDSSRLLPYETYFFGVLDARISSRLTIQSSSAPFCSMPDINLAIILPCWNGMSSSTAAAAASTSIVCSRCWTEPTGFWGAIEAKDSYMTYHSSL